MTDRELLELTAKAAGYAHTNLDADTVFWVSDDGDFWTPWNPLTDDGDALRLAVKLNLVVHPQEKCCYVYLSPESLLGFSGVTALEMNLGDPYAATRRAIVSAAAEIGKAMP